jgi:hypothetical protein
MQWSRDDLVTVLPDKHPARSRRIEIDRCGAKSCAEQAVERGRRAASLHVPEGCRAQRKSNVGLGKPLREDGCTAGTLRHHDDRVILAALVHLADASRDVLGASVNFGNYDDFRASGNSGHKCQVAAAAPHHLHQHRATM